MVTVGMAPRGHFFRVWSVKTGVVKRGRYSGGILGLELVSEMRHPWQADVTPTLNSRTTLEVLKADPFPRQKFSEVKGKKGE